MFPSIIDVIHNFISLEDFELKREFHYTPRSLIIFFERQIRARSRLPSNPNTVLADPP
jgi:hypothetical protein